MIFVLLTSDGALVAGPSSDEYGLVKIASRRAEKGESSQLFKLTHPVIIRPVTPSDAPGIECEASA